MARIIVPPLITELDGCTVYILNVVKRTDIFKKPHFLVSCKVKCGDVESKAFLLDVRSEEELIKKLKYEILLFKAYIYSNMHHLITR